MNKISLFKFSKFFFAMFLLITVLPMLGLLIWADFSIQRHMSERQQQLLGFVSQDILSAYHNHLDAETAAIVRQMRSVDHRKLSLSEYRTLLGAEQLLPITSPEAHAILKTLPSASLYLQRQHGPILSEYAVYRKKLLCVFIIPATSERAAMLVTKPVPIKILAPHGPFRIKLYAGTKAKQSALLGVSSMQHPPPGRFHMHLQGPPPEHLPCTTPPCQGKMVEMHFIHHDRAPRDSAFKPGEHRGPPMMVHQLPPLHEKDSPGFFLGIGPDFFPAQEPFPPPPENFAVLDKPGHEKNFVQKTVPLLTHSGQQVATVVLQTFAFPPSSFLGSPSNQWMGVLIILTGIISSLLAGNYIQKNFIRHLMRLSNVAQNIGEGDLSHRVDLTDIRQAEVRQTLTNINAMLDGLMEKEQLRHSFVSNLTHDFRTPLIAQTRALSLLLKEFESLGLSDQTALAGGILKNNEHLLLMVNQLLETYQTEAGQFTLDLQPTDLPGLVSQCFEQVSALANERHIHFTQEFSADFPKIPMDAHYMTRVLINLIGNAIDNIPKGSHIQVSGELCGQSAVQIHVRDNGPGIPEAERALIFERYYAGIGDTRKLGSGLGLYICAVLVKAHQGTIHVKAPAEGGTDFVIRLPLTNTESE